MDILYGLYITNSYIQSLSDVNVGQLDFFWGGGEYCDEHGVLLIYD